MPIKQAFSVNEFRTLFPLLSTQLYNDSQVDSKPKVSLVYLDNAATTQKPSTVISAYQQFYKTQNANVHRASHALSMRATTAFERSRESVKDFINAQSIEEIIWTRGSTESINLVANSLGKFLFEAGDEIVISASEHHANIVPWQLIAQTTGAVIKVLPIDEAGRIALDSLDTVITSKTKIVCCAHISNVIGKINPIEQVITKAKQIGALTLIDGAQAVAHLTIDVKALDCDFYIFSAHKMYGPTGVGVLYGKKQLLEKMPPYQGGGEMIKKVSFNEPTTFNKLPFKFEAGTPNIAGIVAFEEAISLVKSLDKKQASDYEIMLTNYCYDALAQLPEVTFIVETKPDIPVISFLIQGFHNHDLASTLDSMGIAIRSGHHCAMPLMERLKLDGCIRVSFALYNTFNEVDYFINALKSIIYSEMESTLTYQSESMSKNSNVEEDSHVLEQSIKRNYPTKQDIINIFSEAKGWDERHRVIMLMSKNLKRLAQDKRSPEALIEGCESKAWLIAVKDEHNKFYFEADSDAKLIRGLLVIILSVYNGLTAEQIRAFNIDEYFAELGLMRHLSPSRGNGVLAIVDEIKTLAKA
ncbi:MAG: SufS family cysteine desulfurase [Colwellia sp.]